MHNHLLKNAAIQTLVPDEIYTNRTDFLNYFLQASYKAATRRSMSTVLLGQRRMGKTEIKYAGKINSSAFFSKTG